MPGGLSTWLDDGEQKAHPTKRNGGTTSKKRRVSSKPSCASGTSSMISPRQRGKQHAATGETVVRSSGSNKSPLIARVEDDHLSSAEHANAVLRTLNDTTRIPKQDAPTNEWDPFSNADDQRNPADTALGSADRRSSIDNNAFTRLLQGGTLSSSKPKADAATTPRRTDSWDPFSSKPDEEGKENSRGNAFLTMLAAQVGSNSGGGRSALAGKSRVADMKNAGKRKRVGGGLTGDTVGAATRFCECPVCGKRVIIDLCSKHLDTECEGPCGASDKDPAGLPPSTQPTQITQSPPSATTKTTGSPIALTPSHAHSFPSVLPKADAALVAVVSPPPPDGSTPEHVDAHRTITSTPDSRLLPGLDTARRRTSAREKQTPKVEGKPAAVESDDSEESSRVLQGAKCVLEDGPGNGNGGPPATCSAPATVKIPSAATVRKASSLPLDRKDEKRSAASRIVAGRRSAIEFPRLKKAVDATGEASTAATAVTAVTAAPSMTACPVCGVKVKTDMCSVHLDTDCSGVPAVSPLEGNGGAEDDSRSGDAKTESVDKGGEGEKGNKGNEGGAAKDEASGGLTALAAELTCPVCLCLFEDAHGLPCSHRFCLECITGCFRSSKRQECPLCKVPAWKRDLKRDVPLQNIILAYRRLAS